MEGKVKNYWDSEYSKRKWVYGKTPSSLAQEVVKLFKENSNPKILDIGGGYGRDAVYYAEHGFDVTCMDISSVAINQGRELTKLHKVSVEFIEGDILEIELSPNSFEGIVSYRVLYLFPQRDLKKIIAKIHNLLREGGITAHIVFSEKEVTFGEGEKLEQNTFKWDEGKIVHYFTKEELEKLWGDKFKILELRRVITKEEHDFPHIHKDWFLLAKNEGGIT